MSSTATAATNSATRSKSNTRRNTSDTDIEANISEASPSRISTTRALGDLTMGFVTWGYGMAAVQCDYSVRDTFLIVSTAAALSYLAFGPSPWRDSESPTAEPSESGGPSVHGWSEGIELQPRGRSLFRVRGSRSKGTSASGLDM